MNVTTSRNKKRNYLRVMSQPLDTGSISPRVSTVVTNMVADGESPVTDQEIVEEALRILASRVVRGSVLTNPRATRDWLRVRLADLEYEVFGIVWLDNRNRVIKTEELFRGTLDGATVFPRDVVKAALKCNAAAAVLYHNHPSAVTDPSQADELITRRLKEALSLIDVRVLDHLVVSALECTSMAERGLI